MHRRQGGFLGYAGTESMPQTGPQSQGHKPRIGRSRDSTISPAADSHSSTAASTVGDASSSARYIETDILSAEVAANYVATSQLPSSKPEFFSASEETCIARATS